MTALPDPQPRLAVCRLRKCALTLQLITFSNTGLINFLTEREVVQAVVKELENAGIVKESNSDFMSAILTGEKRLCVDFQVLNRIAAGKLSPTAD